jgi:hypothetical protein
MAPSANTRATIIKFALIVIISACIAGIVGGVTSRVARLKEAQVVHTPGSSTVNGTMKGVRMVERVWVG